MASTFGSILKYRPSCVFLWAFFFKHFQTTSQSIQRRLHVVIPSFLNHISTIMSLNHFHDVTNSSIMNLNQHKAEKTVINLDQRHEAIDSIIKPNQRHAANRCQEAQSISENQISVAQLTKKLSWSTINIKELNQISVTKPERESWSQISIQKPDKRYTANKRVRNLIGVEMPRNRHEAQSTSHNQINVTQLTREL